MVGWILVIFSHSTIARKSKRPYQYVCVCVERILRLNFLFFSFFYGHHYAVGYILMMMTSLICDVVSGYKCQFFFWPDNDIIIINKMDNNDDNDDDRIKHY